MLRCQVVPKDLESTTPGPDTTPEVHSERQPVRLVLRFPGLKRGVSRVNGAPGLSVNLFIQLQLRVRPPRNAFQMHLIFASNSTTGGVIWKLRQGTLQQARQLPAHLVRMRTNNLRCCRSWPATSKSILQKHKHLHQLLHPVRHRQFRSFPRVSSYFRKKLLKTNTPSEFRLWVSAFRRFHEASNLKSQSIATQQGYLLQALSSELQDIVEQKLTTTMPIFGPA